MDIEILHLPCHSASGLSQGYTLAHWHHTGHVPAPYDMLSGMMLLLAVYVG